MVGGFPSPSPLAVETVRREKPLDSTECNSHPQTGSLHPVAGCHIQLRSDAALFHSAVTRLEKVLSVIAI